MKRRLLSTLLACVMVVSLLPTTIFATESTYATWAEASEEANPTTDYTINDDAKAVEIATAMGLAWFANELNNTQENSEDESTIHFYNVTLTADVDLRTVGVADYPASADDAATWDGTNSWTAIGTYMDNSGDSGDKTRRFRGTFDGGDNTISGVYIKKADADTNANKFQGLFGSLGVGATVKNVTVDESYIEAFQFVGGIAGNTSSNGGNTIRNCHNQATVVATHDTAGGIIGQIYGGQDRHSLISQCSNTGSISGGYNVGGITGISTASAGNVTIEECYNTGDVQGSSDGYVGGIVGNADGQGDNIIQNCYNTGTISCEDELVGGIVGQLAGSQKTVENCYNMGAAKYPITRIATGHTISNCYYDITKTTNHDKEGIKGLTPLIMTGENALSTMGFSGGIWETKASETTTHYYPTLINNPQTTAPSADFSSFENWAKAAAAAATGTDYTVSDDTKTYTIKTAVGLAWVADQVNNKNNTFSGETVQLANDIDLRSANVVGYDEDTIMADEYSDEKSWAPIGYNKYPRPFQGTFNGDGHTISGVFINEDKDYRGLFAAVSGTIQNLIVADSNIKGSGEVGGIVGWINDGTVQNCVFTGKVTGSAQTGGIAGYNTGTVENCYNTGAIKGNARYVGGVVGQNGNDAEHKIQNCYNIGTVTTDGTAAIGGVACYGDYSDGIITNCYYNSDKTTDSITIAGVTALSTAQMVGTTAKTTMSGFLETDWNFEEKTQGSHVLCYYPTLKANPQSDIPYLTKTVTTLTVTLADWDYGETPATPSVTTNSDATATYAYYSDSNYTTEVTLSDTTDVSTYYLVVTLPTTDAYTAATETISFDINPADADGTLSMDITDNATLGTLGAGDILAVTYESDFEDETLAYQWYQNDEAIAKAITSTYTVTDTEGAIYCKVTLTGNTTGTVTSKAVTVGATAPVFTAITATAGNGSVTLNWTVDDKDAEIVSYGLTMDETLLAVEIDPTATSYTVSDLTNGTEYIFVLTASNVMGDTDSQAVTGKPVQPTSGGSYTPTPKPTISTDTNPDGTTTATVKPTVSNGSTVTSSTIKDKDVDTAIDAALSKKDDDHASQVEIKVEPKKDTSKVNVTLTTDALTAVADSDVDDVTITTHLGAVTLPSATAKAVADKASGTVTVTLERLDSAVLTKTQQTAVGDAQVYDVRIASGKENLSSFDGNEISISLPYKLAEGESAERVVVWHLAEDGSIEALEGNYNAKTATATFATDRLSYYVALHNNNPFADVNVEDYCFAPVMWAVENNVTSGTTPTTFSPEMTCTRAQAVTFLYRAAGSPEVTGDCAFTDVNADSYYYDAVLWAVREGITAGTSDISFSPDAICSRSQIVTFLYRAAGETKMTGDCVFSDVNADAYCYDAVLWAVSEGITSGTTATTFSPIASCTRGQIVTFLYRNMVD